MSWDKNTINLSDIHTRIQMLKEMRVAHKVDIMGEVVGMGLNDTYLFEDLDPKYKLMRLEYGGKVYLERMHRTYDCDSDDTILLHEFKIEDEPEEWHLEVYEDYADFVDGDGEDEQGCINKWKPAKYYGNIIFRRKK